MRTLVLLALSGLAFGQIVTPPSNGGSGSGTVNTGTIHDLAYYAASGTTVGPLATANSAILVTNSSGVPAWGTTLPPFSVGAGPSCPTGVVICFSESTSPSGAAAGVDVLTSDSGTHCFQSSLNGGSFLGIPQMPSSFTSGHLVTFAGSSGCLLADGGAAGVGFSSITGGTNTTAAMVVGSGASFSNSNLTSGRVKLSGTSGLEVDSAGFTFVDAANSRILTLQSGSSQSGNLMAVNNNSGQVASYIPSGGNIASYEFDAIQGPAQTSIWQVISPANKIIGFLADHQLVWRSVTTGGFFSGGSTDTGISRITAADIGVGTGTQGTISGTIQAGVTATDPGCTTTAHIGKYWFNITTTTTVFQVCMDVAGTVGWVIK